MMKIGLFTAGLVLVSACFNVQAATQAKQVMWV